MTTHYMILEVVLGRPLDTFFCSHNFMVTALGSCVKWPLRPVYTTVEKASGLSRMLGQDMVI